MCAEKNVDFDLEDHIRGVIYGNCIGDAIGLLTEFLNKKESENYYKKFQDELEYDHKVLVPDMHRMRWKTGDWTDDSDQMILIMMSVLEKNKVCFLDIAARLKDWSRHGFAELGDTGGLGIGATTSWVLEHPLYGVVPHEAAQDVWEETDCYIAANGCVMRTSILGVYQYQSLEQVIENTLNVCKITHADPRCQAACVAVTTAIAIMLQRSEKYLKKDGSYKIEEIVHDAYETARKYLPDEKSHAELKSYMYEENLKKLKLDEQNKIGYVYKCMGSGFWCLRQKDFRTALQTLIMEGGDADTNGAVAGALLGCKLGASKLPPSWLHGLLHKNWLDKKLERFLELVIVGYKAKEISDTAERPSTSKNLKKLEEHIDKLSDWKKAKPKK